MNSIKIVLAIVVSSFLITGCGKKEEKQTDFAELNKVIPVSAGTVQKKDITNEKTYSGSLEGVRQSNIVAKIPERIVSIKARVGDYVNTGSVIIELDKTGPSSQYLQAQANLENTQREMERMNALFEEGAVAKQAVDQTQTAYSVAKANFEAARSAVELTSPISGRITAINISPGDWVNPGTVLAIVAEINQMIIEFNVSETEIGSLKVGTPVKVFSEFNDNLAQQGKITEINRSASLDARSFGIKAQFPNTKDIFFKPGMFVKVNIILQSREDVLTIPTEAVTNQEDGAVVYTIKNGLSFLKEIKTGFTNDELTQVTEGLAEGDSIVTAGMNNLSDSTRVSIIK